MGITITAQTKTKGSMRFPTAKETRSFLQKLTIAEGRQVKGEYDKLQSHFQSKHRAKIITRSGTEWGENGSIFTAVGTNVYSRPLVWLETGTAVRYRAMSYDFMPITRPGMGTQIFPGRGRRGGFAQKPGIEPRHFRDDIVRRRYPKFYTNSMSAWYSFWRNRGL